MRLILTETKNFLACPEPMVYIITSYHAASEDSGEYFYKRKRQILIRV